MRIVIPVTFRRFWMEAGIPTPNTPRIINFWKLFERGSSRTQVVFLRAKSSTKKYRQATQLERKVASPAPSAPMPRPQGMMKKGSRMIFRMQPLMVPTLA